MKRKQKPVCNRDCLNCLFDDCIRDEMTHEDYKALRKMDFICGAKEAPDAKIAAYQKAYREANREEIAAYQKAYYEANREEIAAKRKAYREANREEIAAKRKAYYEANREEIAAKSRKLRFT